MNARTGWLGSLVAAGLFACGAPLSTLDGGELAREAVTAQDAGSTQDAGSAQDAGNSQDAGQAELSLSANFPNAMTRTGNTLDVRLVRGSQAVEGATVTVALWMPAHGHGAPAPTVTERGGGDYRAQAVNFTMPGAWDVTVTATKAGETKSTVLHAVVP